ncbi:hypothetical protein ETH_00001290 [Eimeria tenella]|uniref:Uncharacterized protein n=1 Tax=Eimeria tenella TaxID=5802 RepID=U6KZE2_EIMTE|nr:hypothetical protein ETH_00001290 [Eimeria tenella]CDJ43517.1 hypothetical protein ETH_00001290 [Eimeria tenella]|eukprot:XP_013234267.1 hypothetical protein ETH_00001290 [Eimeria tenella]
MRKLLLKKLLWLPGAPAACEQPQQQQQQQQQDVSPLAAAADFVGLKVLGSGDAAAAAAATAAAAAETAAADDAAAHGPLQLQDAAAARAALSSSSSSSSSSKWERALLYTFGLHDPRRLSKTLNPKEVDKEVLGFRQTLEKVDPQDACKYLQLEEFKCLKENQAHAVNPKP